MTHNRKSVRKPKARAQKKVKLRSARARQTIDRRGFEFRKGSVRLFECVTVSAIFIALLYVGWALVWGDSAPNGTRERTLDLMRSLSDNWRAFLVLLIPLYFRSLRALIRRITRIKWIDNNFPQTPAGEQPGDNPATPPSR